MAKPPQRRSVRRFDWDYASSGPYFITINTYRGRSLIGVNDRGRLRLSEAGIMVADCWLGLPLRILGIRIDASIVRPNHFHGILWIQDGPPRSRPTVARAIMAFKSLTTVA